MSVKTLSAKLARLKWYIERTDGAAHPPEFVVHFGADADELYTELIKDLTDAEQTPFFAAWRQIREITTANDQYYVHAQSDGDLDELADYLALLKQRGVKLAARIRLDQSAGQSFIIDWGIGVLDTI